MTDTDIDVADAYRRLRTRCLELGRSLTDEQSAAMSPCCPAWSVKDLFAHMSGVAADILSGNVEGAATEAWADAQVERRRSDSLRLICNEWEGNGSALDEVIESFGATMPPQFYLDAWTHEWDIRQALGSAAAIEPDLDLARSVRTFLTEALKARALELAAELGGEPFELTVTAGDDRWTDVIGDGEPTSRVTLTLFELARLTMGRRSAKQIEAIRPGADPRLLVFWSVNDHDITDPVL